MLSMKSRVTSNYFPACKGISSCPSKQLGCLPRIHVIKNIYPWKAVLPTKLPLMSGYVLFPNWELENHFPKLFYNLVLKSWHFHRDISPATGLIPTIPLKPPSNFSDDLCKNMYLVSQLPACLSLRSYNQNHRFPKLSAWITIELSSIPLHSPPHPPPVLFSKFLKITHSLSNRNTTSVNIFKSFLPVFFFSVNLSLW